MKEIIEILIAGFLLFMLLYFIFLDIIGTREEWDERVNRWADKYKAWKTNRNHKKPND